MQKYYNGVSFERRTIKEGDKQREVVIAMTDSEYNDRSYRDYLLEAEDEKTRDELKKLPKSDPARKTKKRAELGGLYKEYLEYSERQKKQHENKKKYF